MQFHQDNKSSEQELSIRRKTSGNFIKKSLSENNLMDFVFSKYSQRIEDCPTDTAIKDLQEELQSLQRRKNSLEKEIEELDSLKNTQESTHSNISPDNESTIYNNYSGFCKQKKESIISPQESFIFGILVAFLLIGLLSFTGVFGLSRKSRVLIGFTTLTPKIGYNKGSYIGSNSQSSHPVLLTTKSTKPYTNPNLPNIHQNIDENPEINVRIPEEISNLFFHLTSKDGQEDLQHIITAGKKALKSKSEKNRRAKRVVTGFRINQSQNS